MLLDNECGLVSSGNNIAELENNLVAISSKENMEKMARNARAYALSNFKIEEVTNKFSSIIDSLTAS